MRLRSLVLLSIFTGSGCATLGSYLDPEPTPPGEIEASVQVEVGVTERGDGSLVLPNAAIGIRQGIADGIDLGARASALGLEANMRASMFDEGSIIVSLVPALGVAWVPITNDDEGTLRLHTALGVVGGWRLSSSVMLWLGARPALVLTGANIVIRGRFESVRASLLLGAQVGIRVRITRNLGLLVEVGGDPVYTFNDPDWGRPPLHAGAALRFR